MTDPTAPQTWALLLAKWTEFARASVSFPKTHEGDRWRDAVAPIIAIQAVVFALRDLDALPDDERALAIDRSEMLLRKHAGELYELWHAEPLPDEVELLVEDSRRAFNIACFAGVEWCVEDEMLVADHPAALAMALIEGGFDGDLIMPVPGVTLFRSSPAAFARSRLGGPPDPQIVQMIGSFLGGTGGARPIGEARQVYRQFDFASGGAVRDLVRSMEADLPAGQPLLTPVIASGEVLTVPIPPRAEPQEPLPVVFDEG